MGKHSETWKSEITFLEVDTNTGEMEIEVTCKNGKKKEVYAGYISLKG